MISKILKAEHKKKEFHLVLHVKGILLVEHLKKGSWRVVSWQEADERGRYHMVRQKARKGGGYMLEHL